jgi:phosphotriesterase-related protein
MPEPQVITVAGPMPASRLGVVNAHEHLFLRSPALAGQELDDLERTTAEVTEARASGVGAIVEMTPIGCGRRPDLLRAVAESTGVAIIAATGYHRDAHYPVGHWVHDASVEVLADRIVADLTRGMHPADWEGDHAAADGARAGAIKAGASYHVITPGERRRLEAAAIGSRASGAAVLVHAEVGTAGHEIVDALEAGGMTPDRIILSHMDRNPDFDLHAELAARGVTLEYDTLGRTKYHPDSTLLDLIGAMVEAGHGDRLMLGCDLGRRDYFRSYGGGPGMAYLMTTFVPRLRGRIGHTATEAILVTTPARVYALAGTAA